MKISDSIPSCDLVTAEKNDWGSAPDPGIFRMRANSEGRKEVRMVETTRPSVLVPDSALELLPSRALSSGQGERIVPRELLWLQSPSVGSNREGQPWSCLAEPGEQIRLGQNAHWRNPKRTARTTAKVDGHDKRKSAFRDATVSHSLSSKKVVPLGRAKSGPVWPGLDSGGRGSRFYGRES